MLKIGGFLSVKTVFFVHWNQLFLLKKCNAKNWRFFECKNGVFYHWISIQFVSFLNNLISNFNSFFNHNFNWIITLFFIGFLMVFSVRVCFGNTVRKIAPWKRSPPGPRVAMRAPEANHGQRFVHGLFVHSFNSVEFQFVHGLFVHSLHLLYGLFAYILCPWIVC